MSMQPENWIYIGRRETRKGKLAYCYLTDAGEELAYGKGGARTIGAMYAVEADREDDGISAKVASASFVEANAASDEQIAEWTTLDRAAYQTDEARKTEARAKRDTSAWDNQTLAQLRQSYRKLPWSQQAAMAAYITRYLNE